MSERPHFATEKTPKTDISRRFAIRARTITEKPEFLQYTRDAIAEFRHKLARSEYSKEDRQFINSALDLAIVAYQDNDHKKLRVRKQTVSVRGMRHQIPYIQHPLTVADAMLGEPRLVKLGGSAESGAESTHLRVDQRAYKAEVVAAALLHDVIEDVRLKKPQQKLLIEGRERWSEFMRGYFGSFRSEQVESVITMVNAVTKRVPLRDAVRTKIYESRVFQTVRDQLPYGSTQETDEIIDDQVIRSLSDLYTMLQTCFGMGSDLHFDSQSFMNYFGALAIKCHDIENNLEDGGVREDKRIRAQVLALFARIYGLPVASRIAAHLVTDVEHDMFWGHGNERNNLNEAQKLVNTYALLENEQKKPELTFYKNGEKFPLRSDAVQIPIFSSDEIENTRGFKPVLQFLFRLDDNEFLDEVEQTYRAPQAYLRINWRSSEYVGIPVCEASQEVILDAGRRCYYFNVYHARDGVIDPKNPRLTAIVRMQDTAPTAHDTLRQDQDVDPVQIPESRILSRDYKGSPQSAMRVFEIICSSGEV